MPTERVLAAVRSADARTPVLREHGYLANVGVPPGIAAPADTAWAYSPHGYDLVVDTAHAARASDTRAGTIFARFREEQERLGVPVVVGEWGALGTAPAGPAAEAAARHATFLADRFDEYGWSWAYWCWEPGFDRGAVAAALTRPRPLAFAGTGRAWRVAPDRFTASWDGTACGAPTELYLPWEGPVRLVHDGAPAAYQRDGAVVRVPAGTGGFALEALR